MTRSPVFPGSPKPRNAFFAKCARGFAKGAARLPGSAHILAGSLIGALVMTTVGAFGTGAMPVGTRGTFWLILIGWNAIKWQTWFAWRIREPSDWMMAGLVGAVVLNLSLPLEIAATLTLFSYTAGPIQLSRTWVEALAISGAILAVVLLVRSSRSSALPNTAVDLAIEPAGILSRAGLRDPKQLSAIEAEDHFCRLYLYDGRTVLVHARFGDVLREVSAWNGAGIHRGSWVRAGAVRGAYRTGRRWLLGMDGGVRLPVSARYLPQVRTAGWLRPPL